MTREADGVGLMLVFQGGKLSLRAGVGQEQTVSQDESMTTGLSTMLPGHTGPAIIRAVGKGNRRPPGAWKGRHTGSQ